MIDNPMATFPRRQPPPSPKQSRLGSFAEACFNIAIGYGVSVLGQMIVLPLFDLHPSMTENLLISAAFTAISLVRSYAVRRLFESFRNV